MTAENKRSLFANTFYSFASQIYTALISILLVPIYIEYMGEEAYGLVAFFILMQAWFALLDIGFSGYVIREVSRSGGKKTESHGLVSLIRGFEWVFLLLALAGLLALHLISDYIAVSWLNLVAL